MKFVILTGMSGAGKSTALKMLEDMGYFCVDNLPIALIEKFAELADMPGSETQKVAVGIDIRSGQHLEGLQGVLENLRNNGKQFQILYLDSTDEVLVKRYKETRRTHPLSGGERVDRGIAEERVRMEFLKKQADYILDTSNMLTRELKTELEKIFVQNQSYRNLFITIVSFGFKYGIPTDSDLVFDVRFLPNPYYVEGLRAKTGNDKEIQEFVMKYKEANEFLDKLEDMLRFLIPNYIAEGKTQLVISIGCTGGKHRSVTLANALYHRLENEKEFGIKIEHRDIQKDALRRS
ncbi:MAG: RNase adapter RapZ [Clostridiales bacterium]|mgnify:CR=1 FL=1|uniref:RNase adapter RapZ n=1 Tax=Roseburia sp. MSJ-14 TaxID=2841514 RepID=UPI00169D24CD|nr:RNase adapter RapZ [Roseburia sp. MSJ-14]MBU5474986.1 RNase adapter RapZ [Roseburia sp. MSJ-14]NLK78011.1 RNase adapter RapZ [Clostridiales bacterium]